MASDIQVFTVGEHVRAGFLKPHTSCHSESKDQSVNPLLIFKETAEIFVPSYVHVYFDNTERIV